jgi:hypothetical protein
MRSALRHPLIRRNAFYTLRHRMSMSESSTADIVVPEGFEKIVEGQASMLYAKSEGNMSPDKLIHV